MVADDDNYCNPAKGSLFAMADGTNVFFTYGKGVLVRTDNNAADYINEIGVGFRRLTNGYFILNYNYEHMMTPNDAYGGIYLTSTPGGESGNINYWGKADFKYDLSDARYLLDDEKKAGLQGMSHGCFVRCVRTDYSEKPGVSDRSIEINATFKYDKQSSKLINKGSINVSHESDIYGSLITDDKGKVKGTLTLPSNVDEVLLEYSHNYKYYSRKVSVNDLSSDDIIILL